MNRFLGTAVLLAALATLLGLLLAGIAQHNENSRIAEILHRTCARYVHNRDTRELIHCISPSLKNSLQGAQFSEICLPDTRACQAKWHTIAYSSAEGMTIWGTAIPPFRSLLGLLSLLPLVTGALTFMFLKRKSERALQRAQIESSTATKIRVANQVLHDLKAPIASLRTVLTVGSNETTPELRQLIQITHDRLNDLSQSLSSELSEQRITTTRTDQVLRQAAIEARAYATSRNRSDLEIVITAITPGIIGTDLGRLKRALQIILHNAIDACGNGARIELSSLGNKISVRDHGNGISLEIREKLGEWGLTHGKSDGTGRGWPTLKQFAKSLNWQIDIRCNEEIGVSETGTLVTLTLPSGKEQDLE